MSIFLDYTAPYSAHTARPYDVAELDAHPDAARLWATLIEECDAATKYIEERAEIDLENVERGKDELRQEISELEERCNELIAENADLKDRVSELEKKLQGTHTQENEDMADKRETKYNCRFLILKGNETLADSHPDKPSDVWGDWEVSGLKSVAAAAQDVAKEFHGHIPSAFANAAVDKRIKSIRVALSRRKGNALWDFTYLIDDTPHTCRAMIMRVGS